MILLIHFSTIVFLGKLYWINEDFQGNPVSGVSNSSVVVDCELSSPSVNVILLHQVGFTTYLIRIQVDGTKFQKIGAQKFLINELTVDNTGTYVCRADGVKDKHIKISKLSKYEHIPSLTASFGTIHL